VSRESNDVTREQEAGRLGEMQVLSGSEAENSVNGICCFAGITPGEAISDN
jgi:hypothetical protein